MKGDDIAEAIDVMFHCEKAIGKANAEKFVLLVSRLARERDKASASYAEMLKCSELYAARERAAEAKSARLAEALEMIRVNLPTPEQIWSGGAAFDVKGFIADTLAALTLPEPSHE